MATLDKRGQGIQNNGDNKRGGGKGYKYYQNYHLTKGLIHSAANVCIIKPKTSNDFQIFKVMPHT